MSGKVDAITAIDNAIHGTPSSSGEIRRDLRSARAVFADLIEECDTLTMTAHAHADSALRSRIAAIRNALARVRGEE